MSSSVIWSAVYLIDATDAEMGNNQRQLRME